MRAAAFIAARPQPDLIGQHQRHPSFALAREHDERLVIDALHYRGAAVDLGIDHAEKAAPMRRFLVRAFEVARYRVAPPQVG